VIRSDNFDKVNRVLISIPS